MSRWPRLARLLAAASLTALVGGCMPSGAFQPVLDLAAAETGAQAALIGSPESAAEASAQTRDLLRSPLTAQADVQVALLNNRA